MKRLYKRFLLWALAPAFESVSLNASQIRIDPSFPHMDSPCQQEVDWEKRMKCYLADQLK